MSSLKINARNNYFVLENGRDCDGVWSRGNVSGFVGKAEAEECWDESAEWSDGMTYTMTSDIEELQKYCDEFGMDIEKCLEVDAGDDVIPFPDYSDYDDSRHIESQERFAAGNY